MLINKYNSPKGWIVVSHRRLAAKPYREIGTEHSWAIDFLYAHHSIRIASSMVPLNNYVYYYQHLLNAEGEKALDKELAREIWQQEIRKVKTKSFYINSASSACESIGDSVYIWDNEAGQTHGFIFKISMLPIVKDIDKGFVRKLADETWHVCK